MNREIKYRLWTGREMLEVGSIEFLKNGSMIVNEEFIIGDKDFPTLSVLLQYTGVDDCDGVNIYDNDIISIESLEGNELAIIGDVVWDFDSWQIQNGGMLNSFKKMKIKVCGSTHTPPVCWLCGSTDVYKNGVCEYCYENGKENDNI